MVRLAYPPMRCGAWRGFATACGASSTSASEWRSPLESPPSSTSSCWEWRATQADGWATISELAEFLQGRHNAVVGLVQRAAERGLVRKVQGEKDRRYVKVHLTHKGFMILNKISRKNITELRALQFEIMKTPQPRPRDIPAAQGA